MLSLLLYKLLFIFQLLQLHLPPLTLSFGHLQLTGFILQVTHLSVLSEGDRVLLFIIWLLRIPIVLVDPIASVRLGSRRLGRSMVRLNTFSCLWQVHVSNSLLAFYGDCSDACRHPFTSNICFILLSAFAVSHLDAGVVNWCVAGSQIARVRPRSCLRIFRLWDRKLLLVDRELRIKPVDEFHAYFVSMHQLHLHEFFYFWKWLALHTPLDELDTSFRVRITSQDSLAHWQNELSEVRQRPILSYGLIVVNFGGH